MRSPRSQRPALALAAWGLLAQNAAPVLALAAALAPASALAQTDPYKQHMENGVKLYEDRNYGAAIAEFQAAYEARPKANPLLNIALCHKARFNYPKAIETLERALAKHSDTMDAADKQASESAIRDMRALLAYVEVKLSPAAEATLVIDDEDQPAGAASRPVPLGPGTHKIGARADGFALAEQSITLVSGDKVQVQLKLIADKGWVTVQAPHPRMTIAIDQRTMGTGQWAGMLLPGTHLVQVYGPGGAPFASEILVVAGKQLNVRAGAGGVPVAMVTITPPTPPSGIRRKVPRETPPPRRQGPYVLGLGAIIIPFTSPRWLASSDTGRNFSAEYGLRGGYQVNSFAGFDLTFQHSNILTSETSVGSVMPSDSSYRLISNRLALGLRLLSFGKTARFIGAIGGGPVFENFSATTTDEQKNECSRLSKGKDCRLDDDIFGVNAFFFLEAGLEIDLDHVLIDLTLEGAFESTNGLGDNGEIFAGQPIVTAGPALRVGYRFW